MNTQDRLMEILLALKDGIMNAITLGLWERWQGGKLVRPYRN